MVRQETRDSGSGFALTGTDWGPGKTTFVASESSATSDLVSGPYLSTLGTSFQPRDQKIAQVYRQPTDFFNVDLISYSLAELDY